MDVLDKVSADYIMSRAAATQKMPAQVIGELVRGELVREAEPVMADKNQEYNHERHEILL
ncbi:hypothetical protein FACS1894147_02830 [Spirochaetia bacterium]|nr:hypothetical protein FACS1894147_02830 [Spirochaetia bacterium]